MTEDTRMINTARNGEIVAEGVLQKCLPENYPEWVGSRSQCCSIPGLPSEDHKRLED